MGRLREDDWACFIDHDACFTTPDWYAQLEEITGRLTEPCVLTATTNRVGSRLAARSRRRPAEPLDGVPSTFWEERPIRGTRSAPRRHERVADERCRDSPVQENLAPARGLRGRIPGCRQRDSPGGSGPRASRLLDGRSLRLSLVSSGCRAIGARPRFATKPAIR